LNRIEDIKNEFVRGNLKLLMSDKEGVFYVCSEGKFGCEKMKSLRKHYKETGMKTCGIGSIRKDIAKIFDTSDLNYLKKKSELNDLVKLVNTVFYGKNTQGRSVPQNYYL
jgi:hypothetical protein